ncbi:MAG: SDR family oxidoreductase [Planctomycetes bacterium]|nr:SDR family oxidoreductase [Planctomycetota bacterium]
MKVLVTGGAGFIGSNIVDALVARGDSVRVLDNLSTGHEANLADVAERIEFLKTDLRDAAAVMSACKGVDLVFHEGALPSVPRSVDDPATSFAVNALGTLNVLLAAKECGVKRVVYAASSSAYGDTAVLPKREDMLQQPQSPYAADKVHGENLCRVFTRVYGLECVALRYFNVFGPRQRPDSAYAAVIPKFVDALLRGEAVHIHGDGKQSRDFTYISDVVKANLLAAEAASAPGQVLNIGAGGRTDLLTLLHEIAACLGVPANAVHGPDRAGDVRDSQADIGLAQRILGYNPNTPLSTGIAATVKWFRAQHAANARERKLS